MWRILLVFLCVAYKEDVGGKSIDKEWISNFKDIEDDELTGIAEVLPAQQSKEEWISNLKDIEDDELTGITEVFPEEQSKEEWISNFKDIEDDELTGIAKVLPEAQSKEGTQGQGQGQDQGKKDIFQKIEDDNEQFDNNLGDDGIFSSSGKPLHLVEGDIIQTDYVKHIIDGDETKGDVMSDVTAIERQKWPNATMPFYFARGVTSKVKDAVRAAVRDLKEQTCINCTELSQSDAKKHRHHVEVMMGHGCYSNIGRRGGKQIISLGYGCDGKGVAIHEFMHALGFWHEQSRLDRDQYITINWGNVYPGQEHNLAKYRKAAAETLGVEYDTLSIMHYGPYAFAKNRRIRTIVPKFGDKNAIGQKRGLSKLDVIQLNKLYCGGITKSTTAPPIRCNGQNDGCCTSSTQCKLGEGDCDYDSDCAGSLVCGHNNCPWGDNDDCCMKA